MQCLDYSLKTKEIARIDRKEKIKCSRFVENCSEKMSKYNLMKGTNFQTK